MFKSLFRKKFVNMCYANQILSLSTQRSTDNILATYLQVDHNIIKKVNKLKTNNISKISEKQLIENCRIMKELNVNIEKIQYLESCLALSPLCVKNRILILKEMGVKSINLHHIVRFPGSMRRSIKQFKKFHGIPCNQNVMQNIINNVGLPVDENSIQIFDCNMRAGDYYYICMMHYKKYYLGLFNRAFHKNIKNKYHSFRELSELFDVLQNKYNFDYEFLCRHPYLLDQSKDNIEYFFNECKDITIGGISMVEVARKCPRILCYSAENVKELLILCKKLEIPTKPTMSDMSIFRLHKQVFLKRYINILNEYELSIWSKHPRMIHLIHFYNMTLTRAEYLRLCNRMTTASIYTYLCTEPYFIRYVRGELSRSSCKAMLMYILCKELGRDKAYLLNYITRHSYWKHVPLLYVAKTIEYLKKYYSVEDICQNVHIILYPQSTIVETLNTLHKEYSSDKGYNFTSSQYLALCLYTLEKKHHFSGDAVWEAANIQGANTNPDLFEDIEKDEYENFVKNMTNNNKAIHDINSIAWLEYLLR